ncbi:hypothetical protein ABHA52_12405 [Enterococcus faecium]|uniref:hypothetical protein n=1 Tax=Enterococcus faecium TaxID=1352 RepID=UPI001105C24A|nr:hypothetical protein [Enterococcus faecium]MDB7485041.1 hypothetical protein [Enterococcus faecium]MDB7490095.1 hypothetical protein [Enterococcus faecium]MDB7492655.1 hypothetical protein [Enterococcus faecium]MDB7495249.1 hypothetical protein [Enterococcus faecium]MDB7497787.1 hypothetical protein [Enterococcus faecium]
MKKREDLLIVIVANKETENIVNKIKCAISNLEKNSNLIAELTGYIAEYLKLKNIILHGSNEAIFVDNFIIKMDYKDKSIQKVFLRTEKGTKAIY